jgi:hypothetical protein
VEKRGLSRTTSSHLTTSRKKTIPRPDRSSTFSCRRLDSDAHASVAINRSCDVRIECWAQRWMAAARCLGRSLHLVVYNTCATAPGHDAMIPPNHGMLASSAWLGFLLLKYLSYALRLALHLLEAGVNFLEYSSLSRSLQFARKCSQ